MYITNYPVFFQCYFRSRTEILMAVCLQLLDFFSRNHFLRGDFIFQWMGGSFSVGDSFLGGEVTPLGFYLLWWGSKNIHGVGSTSIMPLPTRANPGLCCNRIKKKHELQYALENLQEKDLNFTRKCTSSKTNF